ncbi:unnamed protein product [Moneuplotes crassus]|uniref:THH1/TOM1/TOM3 domain-containing protein n=1 Tax=Euplotes crassus TaxID=5936 RepID=A0AAD2CWJ9_EUPCR|nr:unnamed protein product [Moneuplotes crassus]
MEVVKELGFSASDDPDEETKDNCIAYKVYLGFLLALSVVTVMLTCWWTTKFCLIFKTRKKLQTLFLFLVTLSSIARLGYFITEFFWRQGECSHSPSRCGEAPVYWLSSTLFSSAIVVNIFNWIYQTLRMRKFITGVRQKQTVHHIVFASFSGLVLVAYIAFVIAMCALDKSEVVLARTFTLIYAITFFLIGVVFIFVGWKFYREYKKFFEEKARKIRMRILLSILVISITFILRGFVNVAYFWIDLNVRFRAQWLRNNSFWYPVLMFSYFTITEIIPTIFLCMGVRNISHQIERKKEENEVQYNLAITDTSNMSITETLNHDSVGSFSRDSQISTSK